MRTQDTVMVHISITSSHQQHSTLNTQNTKSPRFEPAVPSLRARRGLEIISTWPQAEGGSAGESRCKKEKKCRSRWLQYRRWSCQRLCRSQRVRTFLTVPISAGLSPQASVRLCGGEAAAEFVVSNSVSLCMHNHAAPSRGGVELVSLIRLQVTTRRYLRLVQP
jgi:hypothetical protein